MGKCTTKRIWRHKENYSKHTCLNLLWLRKASHDTDWHVWCRRGNCPLAEWETSVIRVKGLNDCERKNYASIEKEMKAVVFGLHKFSDYCFGRHVTIELDYKSLEAISNKPLSEAPKLLLRIMLSIQNFDNKITYKKGSDVIIADALSRDLEEDDKFQFHFSDGKSIRIFCCK